MESGSFITVAAVGVQQASGAATSAAITIPLMSSGEIARYIRVAATAPACIKLGKTTAVATVNDLQIQPGDAVIMSVNGNDKFAVIQVSTAGIVQVQALENM
jgi:hypothetical protein